MRASYRYSRCGKDDRLLSDVKRSRSQTMAIPTPKKFIYFFQRPEEPGEAGSSQPSGMPPPPTEVSEAKLVGNNYYGATHWPVLMGALSPRLPCFRVDPDRKCHPLPTRQHSLPVWVYMLPHFRLIVSFAVGQRLIETPA